MLGSNYAITGNAPQLSPKSAGETHAFNLLRVAQREWILVGRQMVTPPTNLYITAGSIPDHLNGAKHQHAHTKTVISTSAADESEPLPVR